MTYKEKLEFEQIETMIAGVEAELKMLTLEVNSAGSDFCEAGRAYRAAAGCRAAFGTACGTLGLSYGTGGGERCFLSCLKIERDKYVSRRKF